MIKNLTERKSHVIFLLSVTEDKLLSHWCEHDREIGTEYLTTAMHELNAT